MKGDRMRSLVLMSLILAALSTVAAAEGIMVGSDCQFTWQAPTQVAEGIEGLRALRLHVGDESIQIWGVAEGIEGLRALRLPVTSLIMLSRFWLQKGSKACRCCDMSWRGSCGSSPSAGLKPSC